jgi:hypothetical protein
MFANTLAREPVACTVGTSKPDHLVDQARHFEACVVKHTSANIDNYVFICCAVRRSSIQDYAAVFREDNRLSMKMGDHFDRAKMYATSASERTCGESKLAECNTIGLIHLPISNHSSINFV